MNAATDPARFDDALLEAIPRLAAAASIDALVPPLRWALAALPQAQFGALLVFDADRDLRRACLFKPFRNLEPPKPDDWSTDAGDPVRYNFGPPTLLSGYAGDIGGSLGQRFVAAAVRFHIAAPLLVGGCADTATGTAKLHFAPEEHRPEPNSEIPPPTSANSVDLGRLENPPTAASATRRLIGRIVAATTSGPPFDEAAAAFLERLAQLTAPVLYSCFIQERFDRGDRRRDTLVDLSRAINETLEFDAVLDAARKALARLDVHDRSRIDLFDDNPDAFHSFPLVGDPEPGRHSIFGTYLYKISNYPLTITSTDLQNLPDNPEVATLLAAGVRRYVAAPFLVRGKAIGALFIASADPHPFLKTDVWLFENIALQLGLAIDNARKHTQVRALSERLSQHNVYLREEIDSQHNFGEIVGLSPAMELLHKEIRRVARTDSTVLITGETGVGKELVARAIHAAGRRSAQPMVKVNCAAIPEGMVESELFGHEKGAFTSAVERRTGRFELAHNGTLFLDEVGELPRPIQAKLLRVLQDGEFERVGGSKTLRSDARIIAATNRDLLRAVESGAFRRDLYYRLNVFPIEVPSLAERREDIPLLVETFTAQFARLMGKAITAIDAASLQRLAARDWPGNVRELRHVIERAMILADGPTLVIADAMPLYQHPISEHSESPPETTLHAVEADHIRRVLEHTRGRIEGPKGAARMLGLKPSTLRFRIKKLGIKV